MGHIAVHLICDEDTAETVSFLLQEIGFSGSSYENNKLIAYCPASTFNKEQMDEILAELELQADTITEEEDRNWNEVWERNFKTLFVDDDIQVRAPFHPSDHRKYELIIHPGMAFGTGHHQTTQLMLKAIKQFDLNQKSVLDMGCGSGILAIFSSMLGASEVLAIDYDPLSVENSKVNKQLNNIKNVKVMEASDLSRVAQTFDLILSNIIRKVNIELLPSYVQHLNPEGSIVLSGLLSEDREEVLNAAKALDLQLRFEEQLDNWIQLTFTR